MGDKTINKEEKENVENIYDLLEKFLDGQKWMVGDSPTLADFSLVSTITTLELFVPIDSGKYPKVKSWLDLAKGTFVQYEDINGKGLDIFKLALFS